MKLLIFIIDKQIKNKINFKYLRIGSGYFKIIIFLYFRYITIFLGAIQHIKLFDHPPFPKHDS